MAISSLVTSAIVSFLIKGLKMILNRIALISLGKERQKKRQAKKEKKQLEKDIEILEKDKEILSSHPNDDDIDRMLQGNSKS